MANVDLFLMQDIAPDDVTAMAQLAESIGCANLWLIDGQDVFPDPWTTAAHCATVTSSIRIGPGVTNPLTRHPHVTANAALSVHSLSGGRSILGLGTGDNAVRTLGWRPATLAQLRATIETCRQRFQSDGADIPIFVAAAGPRTTELACEIADGIIVPGRAATPDDLRRIIDRVETALHRCGRDPATLPILPYLGMAISDSRVEALDDARGGVARRVLNFVGDEGTCPPELEHLTAEMEVVAAAYDYSEHLKSHVAHASAVSDELVAAVSIAGTPDDVRPRFEELWDVAEGHNITFFLRPDGRNKRRTFEIFAHEILPTLPAAT